MNLLLRHGRFLSRASGLRYSQLPTITRRLQVSGGIQLHPEHGDSPRDTGIYLRRFGTQGPRHHETTSRSRTSGSHGETSGQKGGAEVRAVSVWNVSNAITVGRIIVAPITGYCILNGEYGLALGGLVYAGASDWLDGFLARRYMLVTAVGSFLDPAADKLLISTTMVCLAYQEVIPTWLVALIVSRDFALIVGWAELVRARADGISAAAAIGGEKGSGIRPHFVSKVNTGLQIALGFCGVISAGDWGLVNAQFIDQLGLATALTTTASGVSYGREFLKLRFGWR